VGYLEAAIQVLRSANRPLTIEEIVDEALRQGLIAPHGKTPRNTMSARLYTTVRDNPDSPIKQVFEPGKLRARRGTVRWVLSAPAGVAAV
jgi:HB1, ASXL, restriction endonuclease HTH domain